MAKFQGDNVVNEKPQAVNLMSLRDIQSGKENAAKSSLSGSGSFSLGGDDSSSASSGVRNDSDSEGVREESVGVTVWNEDLIDFHKGNVKIATGRADKIFSFADIYSSSEDLDEGDYSVSDQMSYYSEPEDGKSADGSRTYDSRTGDSRTYDSRSVDSRTYESESKSGQESVSGYSSNVSSFLGPPGGGSQRIMEGGRRRSRAGSVSSVTVSSASMSNGGVRDVVVSTIPRESAETGDDAGQVEHRATSQVYNL